jgi:hypothetical protein
VGGAYEGRGGQREGEYDIGAEDVWIGAGDHAFAHTTREGLGGGQKQMVGGKITRRVE